MKLRELKEGEIYAIPSISRIVKYASHYVSNEWSHRVVGDFLYMYHETKHRENIEYNISEEVFYLSKNIIKATEEQIRFFCENSGEDSNKYIRKNSSSFSLFNILKHS